MYHVEVKNCNSILKGNIKVKEGKLNIKYGINGTGKTTIAKAIEEGRLSLLGFSYFFSSN